MKKHMSTDDRIQIEIMLKQKEALSKIAERIGKSRSTISREIRKHAIESNKQNPHRIPNRCVKRKECQAKYLCPEIVCANDKKQLHCRLCHLCNYKCVNFEEEYCTRLEKAPYVCNGCEDEQSCVLRKKFYIAKVAQKQYEKALSESRSGANISEEELQSLDKFISPLLRKGQSIHHILVSNPNEIHLSEKSIYRYVDNCLFQAKNHDLPRKMRLRPRKRKSVEFKVDKGCRIGRTYQDYLAFMERFPNQSAVQMDTVVGKRGGKVLLTLLFPQTELLLAFIRDRNTSQSVIDIFEQLYSSLGREVFCRLFPVILTDNGSEFSNPRALEFDREGRRRTSIFYCDPNAAFQKPAVEVAHQFIRRFIRKGHSFDSLSSDDVHNILSHINSYKRKKLNDKSPYETFSFFFGQEILDRLNIEYVNPIDILLNPTIIVP